LAQNLERLLEALNQMRRVNDADPTAVRQIREGVDLAVKLADRLQRRTPTIRARGRLERGTFRASIACA
jgi:methyl coenzyme M reductase beta subunit